MGSLCGHKDPMSIYSLCVISNNLLASGSDENNINLWNIEDRGIISILSVHKDAVSAICYVGERVIVSGGSLDKSLIMWNKFPECSTYSPSEPGHTSCIKGIIRITIWGSGM